MQRGDELVVTLESAAFEGKNIARLDNLVVFVRGGVPGDTARTRLTKIKKQFLEADFVELLSPSPDRVSAPCIHFGPCGGCKWQELAYEAQLSFKRQQVVDALTRLGGFRDLVVPPVLGATNTLYYRNKMEFSFGRRWRLPNASEAEPEWALGLHIAERFDKVLDLDECRLQSEVSAHIVNFTRDYALANNISIYSTTSHSGLLRNLVIRESRRTSERMVNLVTFEDQPDVMRDFTSALLAQFPDVTTVVNNVNLRKSQVALGDFEKIYHGPGYITERIGNRRYRISANSFFQTNTDQAERLYNVVREFAGLTGSEVVYDLYSGTGTIALHLADQAKVIVGIESVEQSITDARSNAEFNGVTNCTFLAGDLKDRLTRDADWQRQFPRPDVVVLDPPRSGMHEKAATQLLTLGAQRIVYVSCNPTTQARDLKILTGDGRYAIQAVQPVDMFPHTYHIENVVLLSSASPRA